MIPTRSVFICVALSVASACTAKAQILKYAEPYLTSIFPAGAQQGQTVTVHLRGVGVLKGDNRIVIDGPAGVTASEVEFVKTGTLRARFIIAADAKPGRRMVRVHNVQHGMTNFRYFDVGSLAEVLEQEPNGARGEAQKVSVPVVINGQINPTLDTDVFRFAARAGQKIVAAVSAHAMDGFVDYRKGYLDTSLQLSDEQGRILATSEDELGLDPLIHATIPADGLYCVTICSLGFQGSDHAVYRLTLGEVPYATAVFPLGGRKSASLLLEITGPNVPPDTKQNIFISATGSNPTQTITLGGSATGLQNFTIMRSELAEIVEVEPNGQREQATVLRLPVIANGRFLQPTDVDWYRWSLKKDEGVLLVTTAQRNFRSPVDTELQVFDSGGTKLASNDDGAAFGKYVQCAHDFESNDSWLAFKAPKDGEYFVRVRDLNGTSGRRSNYRLSAKPLEPDFLIDQWPDAVPIWGPGTSASFVVEVVKWGRLNSDIQVRVEGLPKGWTGGVANWPKNWYPHYNVGSAAIKLLLTITAPPDAPVGTVVPFRVVGRAEQDGKTIEREARYMTLYGSSHNDRMHVRYSPQARAVVAQFKDCWLESPISEVTGVEGETVEIPVQIHRKDDNKNQIGIVVNGPTPSAGCGWGSPVTLTKESTKAKISVSLAGRNPGTYAVVVARSWASDTRAGRPGPCTPNILLHILPKK